MSIVAKFGGSSVANRAQIKKALAITEPYLENGVVLVMSAMGRTTDRLIEIIDLAIHGRRARSLAELNALREEYLAELELITDHHHRLHGVKRIELLCDEMQEICGEMATQTSATDAQQAYFLAHGELLSTTVLHACAGEHGISSRLLDSRELIKTDAQPLKGEVNWPESRHLIQQQIDLHKQILYIAQGFIASSPDNSTTTLGRGGSDYSAALIGAALEVERIEIWTDVDGVLTADPRLVHAAKPVKTLNYTEAVELAHFGTKVIHPSTMVPAIQHNIPLIVRNTNNPDHPGTTISTQTEASGVKAIAVKQDITVININSERMFNAYGFLSRIFSVFATYRTAVDLISTSEISVSLTIDDPRDLASITEELKAIAKVEVQTGQGIISIIAQGLWQDAQSVGRVFDALGSAVPIRLVSLGGSDTNLSLIVDGQYVTHAVKILHRLFFEA